MFMKYDTFVLKIPATILQVLDFSYVVRSNWLGLLNIDNWVVLLIYVIMVAATIIHQYLEEWIDIDD